MAKKKVLIPRSFIITPIKKKQKIVDQIPSPSPKNQVSLSTIDDIPDEIVVEILIRLPVKALIRFTSICKSWKTLISDPHFVKRHLHLSAKDTSLRTRQIILNDPNFRSYSLNSLYSESITYATSILYSHSLRRNHLPVDQILYSDSLKEYNPMLITDSLKKKRTPFYPIIGSCGGLICICIDGYTFFLWNPSIRKLKMLPHLELGSCTAFGFGYDVLNHDFKVVAVYSYHRNECLHFLVEVYSLNANCWRRIGEFPHPIFFDGHAVYVNGTLNWDASPSQVIQSFDLAKETFFEVPQPDFNDDCFREFIMLGELRDCLCILPYYYETRTDVWIMSEYGVKDSWNILISLPCELIPVPLYQTPVPLYILESGEILIKGSKLFLLFDPTSKTIRHPVFHDFEGFQDAVICTESLVLLS